MLNKVHSKQNIFKALKYINLFIILFIIMQIIISLKYKYYSIYFLIISFIFVFISLTLFIYIGGLKSLGVPNNRYKDFKVDGLVLLSNKNLIINEIEQGIWVCSIDSRLLRFDMKKWKYQEKYIFDILWLNIYLHIYNKNKRSVFSFTFNVRCKEIDEYSVKFIDLRSKEKTYYIVKRNKFVSYLSIKLRLIDNWPHNGRGLYISKLSKYSKMRLENFYNFKFYL
jgi:hypothetical protein